MSEQYLGRSWKGEGERLAGNAEVKRWLKDTRRTLCGKRSSASRLRKHRDDEGRFKILKI